MSENFIFQNICTGDSGGPVIWEDKNDKNRAYLVGVLFMRSNPICGVIPPNRRQIAILARNRQPKFLSSQAVIVPGRVFGWVLSQDQPESGELAPEIKECLRDTSNKQGGPEAQEDPKPKGGPNTKGVPKSKSCLLYTSPSPRALST